MKKKFVIGDRTKDEWISVLDRSNKKLEFTNHLASAKEFLGFDDTKDEDFLSTLIDNVPRNCIKHYKF